MVSALAHDDGLGLDTLDGAGVVLAGVSRTGKTPTCMYLAQQGLKAANVSLETAARIVERLNLAQSAGPAGAAEAEPGL